MLKVALNLNRLSRLFHGDFRSVLDVARLGDEKGFDELLISDHLALIPDGYGNYPYGAFPNNPDAPMAEATTFLGAVAAVTEHARLSMSVLIAPLRSGLLLAKQLSMLDVLSNGRLDAAIGAGWLQEEFKAAERPFDGRFTYMEEQVRACRILWSEAPASFEGEHIQFKGLYMLPHPVQGAGLPIWFGLGPTERNVDRIARLADGWVVPPLPEDRIAEGIRVVRKALREKGRDPGSFPIRAPLPPVLDGERVDFAKTYERAARLRSMGATGVAIPANIYCRTSAEIEPLLEWALSLRSI